jgi:UDP-3-O-[3-hydroxymyristoyl] glucosamine N-acyltransferase
VGVEVGVGTGVSVGIGVLVGSGVFVGSGVDVGGVMGPQASDATVKIKTGSRTCRTLLVVFICISF